MKMIFISGKYSAKSKYETELNIELAKQYGLSITKLGGFPIIPHCNTSYDFSLVKPYEFWIEGYLRLLGLCDGIYMLPNWKESHGAKLEKDQAIVFGIPIFFDLGSFEKWISG